MLGPSLAPAIIETFGPEWDILSHICAIIHAHALYLLCLTSSMRDCFGHLAEAYGWAVQAAMVAKHPVRFVTAGKGMSKVHANVAQSLIVSCDKHVHAQYLVKQAGEA